MRKLTLLIIPILLLASCTPYFGDETLYSEYKPILAEREVLRQGVKYNEPRALCNPGKFYMRGNSFFIVEKYEGIHVYDNSDQTNPVSVGFIPILGCADISMKGNFLYADSSVDLLTIDLTNGVENLTVTSRTEDIFPEWMPPDERILNVQFQARNRPANTVIVGWEKM